jgi:hypothetical protein
MLYLTRIVRFLLIYFLLRSRNRSPAPHFRPIRPPYIANYRNLPMVPRSETCLNEPGALDERLQIRVMQSFDVYR